MKVKSELKIFQYSLLVSILFILLLTLIFTIISCKTSNTSENTNKVQSSPSEETKNSLLVNKADDNQNNSIKSAKKENWGPLDLHSGYIRGLHIQDNIGVGSVLYDSGGSSTGTSFVYAMDISDGRIIGTTSIPGLIYAIDICERFAFIWVEDVINIYDLKKGFELKDSLSARWTSNFGNYFFIEDPDSPDYLIDKRTLKRKDLKLPDDNYVFALLYPDCLIGDPYIFDDGRQGDPVIFDIEKGRILGSLKNAILNEIFAWDVKNSLVFYREREKTKILDIKKGSVISEIPYEAYNTDDSGWAIYGRSSFGSLPGFKYYTGRGDRLRVIRDFYTGSNGNYFINFFNSDGSDICYVLDSYGKEKSVMEGAKNFGETSGYIFFDVEESIGARKNNLISAWLKEKPKDPFMGSLPYITMDSLAWLYDCSGLRGHGDAICQWDYKTGSFSNYTEFTNYEVIILSENPFIFAMRDYREGTKGTWAISCSLPSELPFNVEADIEVDYSPDEIYPKNTTVNFTCNLKNVPSELQLLPVSFDWDFGDGTKGIGKEANHVYENKGKYNVNVSVRLGSSEGSTSKSVEVAVLDSADIILTATPKSITAKSIDYYLNCSVSGFNDLGKIEWDFGDGKTSAGGLGINHTYELGEYTAKVKVYIDEKRYFEKEITLDVKIPDFSVTASPDEGPTALNVDFKCNILSSEISDFNLKYAWKLNTETLSDKKAFSKDFIDLGLHKIKLEIRDQQNALITEKILLINVKEPTITISDGGRKITSNTSIFVDDKYDADKDGINQVFENLAMIITKPNFELDEEEDWLTERYENEHRVENFARITPYPSISDPQYILFVYAIAWSMDYGRYDILEWAEDYGITVGEFEAHTGDVEKVVMAWKVINEKNLELKYVYTSAHGGAPTDHCGVWKAKGESTNKGKILLDFDRDFSATLEFVDNKLKLQASEDKHAIYPTEECGDHISLIGGLFGEDCGGGGVFDFLCFNAGEPAVHIMENIGYIFYNESIWSGNINYPGKFCGGLEYDGSPGTIGNTLNDTAMLEEVLHNDLYHN